MIQLSAELLALSGEPALLIRGGKVLYANDAARLLLGADCAGRSFQELFGQEIAEMQASAFVGETEIGGQRMLVRLRAMDGLRALFLSPCATTGELVNEAFLSALRSELMQLGVSASLLQSRLGDGDNGSAAALRGLQQNLFRINRTLQNLSVIHGARTNALPFHPQPLELCALLRDLIDAVRLNLPQPEIQLTLPESAPLLGSPELLEMLVLNLLINCFSHAEGCTRIRVTLRSVGEQLILSVNDDGCGIPSDQLHTVLERYRYSNSLYAAGHGSGFGLSAAREIARLHGGTLLLESREGVGTAVRVSFNRTPRAYNALRSAGEDYDHSYDSILTGLAPCLPPEAFSPRKREG